MKIECPSCGGKGSIDDAMVPDEGINVRCPKCRERFFVQKSPSGGPSPAPASAAPGPRAPKASAPPATPSPAADSSQRPRDAAFQNCTVCKNRFEQASMIRFDADTWVCPTCKPFYLQMVQQGVQVNQNMRYAGFWIRLGAKFLDGLITGIVCFVLALPFAAGKETSMFGPMISVLINLLLPLAYSVFFVGKYRATPGKMACGLVIVRADGDSVSYMRALGRHCAEILSSLILLIGYIMAAFDSEKRALHDRICDTRVIRK